MKNKFFLVLVAVGFLFVSGCAGFQLKDDATTRILISTASSNFGYFVATKMPDRDVSVRAAFMFLRTGALTPEDTAKFIQELKDQEPLLALNFVNVLRALGAAIQSDAINLGGIPDAYWDEAADGYRTGFLAGGGVEA